MKLKHSMKAAENNHQEFLSIKQLSTLIPYSEGAIRNMISKGDFVRGIHYRKPKGRVFFKWSKVVEWIENEGKIKIRKKK